MNTMNEVQISSIVIKNRHRKDLGDIGALAASIEAVGLLQPIVLASDGKTLVAGARRVAAFKHMKRSAIPAYVVKSVNELHEHLQAERDENTCRKEFTPSEAVAMSEAVYRAEKPLAEQRHIESTSKAGKASAEARNSNAGKTFPSVKRDEAKRAKAATAAHVGMSRPTLEKAEAVVKSGDKDLIDLMDRTGKVDRAHKELKRKQATEERQKKAEEASKTIPPEETFGVIIGDFYKCCEIPKASVPLIVTDPPYHRETLELYDHLGEVAARILQPGGSLICYTGQIILPQVFQLLSKHLRYWWTFALMHTGKQLLRMREYGVVNEWKPILWFVKGRRDDEQHFIRDIVTGGGREKDGHAWQQAETEAAFFVEELTSKGELVVDPFCGSGTTAVACKRLKRQWLTYEIDDAAAKLARARIAKQ